jgi:hypothetical protein
VVMSSVGLGTKNQCADEDQQQFSMQEQRQEFLLLLLLLLLLFKCCYKQNKITRIVILVSFNAYKIYSFVSDMVAWVSILILGFCILLRAYH